LSEKHIKYKDGRYREQLATVVHELIHCLGFHNKLFKYFKLNQNQESFLFTDEKGVHKLRGDNIVRESKKHFNCKTLDGGE
jgi:hypothetical protein